MADPLGAAGADLVEALVRGAMSSPYAAADPAGGELIAQMIEQLAVLDSSRIGRLLSPNPGPAQYEVEIHRTGDIVPELVLRDLGALDALREAIRRAGDPGRSVELVVVPASGDDEVLLASRPGHPLSYLFADDVRVAAGRLAPTPAGSPASPFQRDWPSPDAPAAAPAPLPPVASVAAPLAAVPVHAASHAVPEYAGPGPSGDDLSAAIEAALAEMSIQVDLAGVAELVQEAVIEHLRTEGAAAPGGFAAGADAEAVAARVAAHLGERLPAERGLDTVEIAERVVAQLRELSVLGLGLGQSGLREVLLELTETVALRDRRLAMEQQGMQLQLEALHAQIQHAEHAMTDALDTANRELVGPEGDVRDEVISLGRSIDVQLRALSRQVEDREPEGDVRPVRQGDELRRAASDLARVADRLDSLVRHLDQSVDLRALGRMTRGIERAAASLGVAPTAPLPAPARSVAPLGGDAESSPRAGGAGSSPRAGDAGGAGPSPRADEAGAGSGVRERPLRPRARLKRPAISPGDHPLRLVDPSRASEPPGA